MLQLSQTRAIGLHSIVYIHTDLHPVNQKVTLVLASGKTIVEVRKPQDCNFEQVFAAANPPIPCVIYDTEDHSVLIASRYIQEIEARPNGGIEIRVLGDKGFVFREAGDVLAHVNAVNTSFTEMKKGGI